MNPASLRIHKSKELAQMARQAGVTGWHSMRKEELISAILKVGKQNPNAVNGTKPKQTPTKPKISRAKQRIQKKIANIQAEKQRLHDLSTNNRSEIGEIRADRLVLLVRDPYWLHASWEISAKSIERARTALGQEWHNAAPVLRLHRLDEQGNTSATRQITIHGGVSNWYIDVINPPSSYRCEIGYCSKSGRFYGIARSNDVGTPTPTADSRVDENWNDVARNADHIYAMSGGYSATGASLELQEMLEERLQRRLGRPADTRFGNGATTPEVNNLKFSIDVDLMVHGSANPHTHLTIQGEPVAVRADGTFTVKLPFPDRRQVIPIVASSATGTEERTIILGVERNTKHLESTKRESPPR